MTQNKSITDSIASAEWSIIAEAIKKLEVGLDSSDPKIRRLRAKTGIIKIMLYEKTNRFNGDDTLDLAFFIGALKSIRNLETEYVLQRVEKSDLIVLLNLLIHKFKKQKLRAKKPMAMLKEFEKMKDVMDNGNII